MSRRLVARFDVRPFVVLAVILLVGTLGERLVSGVMSALLMITVAVVGSLVAATVCTVGRDSRTGFAGRWWHALPPAVSAAVAPVESDVDVKDAA